MKPGVLRSWIFFRDIWVNRVHSRQAWTLYDWASYFLSSPSPPLKSCMRSRLLKLPPSILRKMNSLWISYGFRHLFRMKFSPVRRRLSPVGFGQFVSKRCWEQAGAFIGVLFVFFNRVIVCYAGDNLFNQVKETHAGVGWRYQLSGSSLTVLFFVFLVFCNWMECRLWFATATCGCRHPGWYATCGMVFRWVQNLTCMCESIV